MSLIHLEMDKPHFDVYAVGGSNTEINIRTGDGSIILTLSNESIVSLYEKLVDRRSRIAQKQLHEAETGKWCTCTDPVHAGGDGCAVHGGVTA